jgi:hypothetical protein
VQSAPTIAARNHKQPAIAHKARPVGHRRKLLPSLARRPSVDHREPLLSHPCVCWDDWSPDTSRVRGRRPRAGRVPGGGKRWEVAALCDAGGWVSIDVRWQQTRPSRTGSTPGQLAVTSRMQVSPGYYFRVIFAAGVEFSRVRAE